jgi:NitT/TauT family transport system permease protein
MASRNWKPLLLMVGILAFWHFICAVGRIDSFLLPSPIDIARAIGNNVEPLYAHSVHTLWVTAAGLALATLVGIPLGLIVGASRGVYETVYPLMVAFNAVPKVAILPVIVVWFGIGALPAIATAFALSFFPIVVNLAIAIRTMEPEMQDVLRSLGATRWQILRKVGLPRAMPYFFAGFKVAITLAFVGTVLAETVAGSSGIGYLMMAASARMDLPLVFAGLTVIATMSVLIYYCVEYVEHRTTAWAMRGEGTL